MEITPPISPSRDPEVESEFHNILQERGDVGFHCDDEHSKTLFNSKGFLLNGDGNLAESIEDDRRLRCSFVNLFNQLYDIDNSIPENLEQLFRISRNKICILETAHKTNKGSYGLLTNINNSENNSDLNLIRKQLREFYLMLRILIAMQSNDEEYIWVINELLPTITRGLLLNRIQLGWLSELHGSTVNYVKRSPAHTFFQLFHCHLDLRWLHISVLWTLASCMNVSSRCEASQVTVILQMQSPDSNLQNLLQSTIQLCMYDMIKLAVLKFNKLNHEQIIQTSLFNCKCVKELWLLLKFVTESSNNHDSKSFWKLIDGILEMLVKGADTAIFPKKGGKPLSLPTQLACSDPCIFSLWLLKHIGELYKYSKDGTLLTTGACDIERGQLTLKRVLSNVSALSDIDEPQRRVLVGLVSCLLTDPWKPKPELIMMLWDGFYRKLDSAFQLPGAPTSSYMIASETILDIFNSVPYNGVKTKLVNANSFDMFLILLGKYLKNDPSQWKSKMWGRFCSKLSQKKVDSLSEIGLYHLCQLILTIAIQTDSENLVTEFQKWACFNDSNEKRNVLVMKAQLCFVYLFAREGKPWASLITPLIEKLDSFSILNHKSVSQCFVTNLQYIVNCNESLVPDLQTVCGKWIISFLKHNTDSSQNLFRLIVRIIEKLQKHLDCSNRGGVEVKELVSTLHENVLPIVKDSKWSSVEQVADSAALFTLISLELHNPGKEKFNDLLHYFLKTASYPILFVGRYLFYLCTHSKVDMSHFNEQQQELLIQAWIRCSVLSLDENQRYIAEFIFKMPVLTNFINPRNSSSTSRDPLVYFIEAFGDITEKNGDARKAFSKLIEPLKPEIHKVAYALFPPKAKDTNWKTDQVVSPQQPSKNVIVRVFEVCGHLTYKCSAFIYAKNNAGNFLINVLNNLIVPPVVLDLGNVLPHAMDEGLRKFVILYLRGLFKLDPSKDICIRRFFYNIVKVYVSRFGSTPHNPFEVIWDEPEHMSSDNYIVDVLCASLLSWDKSANAPTNCYMQGLHFINGLLNKVLCDDVLLAVLIDNLLRTCLCTVARLSSNPCLSGIKKRQLDETLKTLKLVFNADAYQSNLNNLWDQSTNVLNKLAHTYLKQQHSNDILFRMLHILIKVGGKDIVEKFYPELEKIIEKTCVERGSGNEKNFRILLSTLKTELNQSKIVV